VAKNGLNDICVVGCGPSLKGFDWSLLASRSTIAVNGAVADVPNADYFVTADSRFVRMAVKNSFWRTAACKVLVMRSDHRKYHYVKPHLQHFDIVIAPSRFDGNIGFAEQDFCTGQNSGFCGMQLAVILGAKTIRLLGMDFHCEGGEHYHSRYESSPKHLNEFYVHFVAGIKVLLAAGVAVISHSSTSRLNGLIPYEPLERIV
jgi:hypothetical protein